LLAHVLAFIKLAQESCVTWLSPILAQASLLGFRKYRTIKIIIIMINTDIMMVVLCLSKNSDIYY